MLTKKSLVLLAAKSGEECALNKFEDDSRCLVVKVTFLMIFQTFLLSLPALSNNFLSKSDLIFLRSRYRICDIFYMWFVILNYLNKLWPSCEVYLDVSYNE